MKLQLIFASLLLSFNTVASTLLRSASQERRNLVTEEEVLSDITKLIKKQFGGNCDKFYRTFDTTQDGSLSEVEVAHLASRLSVFLLVANAGNTEYEPITASKLYEQCRDRDCSKECFCPTSTPSAPVPVPVPVPAPIPAPVPTPVPEPPVGGGVVGDPHFITWYGSHFSYHGACDLVFLHNPLFGEGIGLDLHIRTEHMMEKAYSFVSNAALRIGDDVLEVAASGKHFLNGVHDAELPARLGGYEATKTVDEKCVGSGERKRCWYSMLFDVSLGQADHIIIKVSSGMVHVNVQGSPKIFEGSVGVMGTYPALHHGKIARDGVTFVHDSDSFAQEWQVLDSEPKLFSVQRFPQHPQMCIPAIHSTSLERHLQASTETRTAAEKACAHVSGPEWEFCVFDVLATGDYGMAATIYG